MQIQKSFSRTRSLRSERLLLSINVIYSCIQCISDGTNCHSLISRSGPIQHFQVDPYNGFLYWIETNTDGDSNLLQWDWECTSPKEPVVILTRTSLGSFVVVHDLGEILIPDKDQNEMLRVTLGEEIKIL